jgi:hypothetical protein
MLPGVLPYPEAIGGGSMSHSSRSIRGCADCGTRSRTYAGAAIVVALLAMAGCNGNTSTANPGSSESSSPSPTLIGPPSLHVITPAAELCQI